MTTIGRDEFAQRHERVRKALEHEGLDAILAYSTAKVQANVRYVSRKG